MVLKRIADWFTADPRAQRAMLEQRAAMGPAVIPWQVGRPQWLPRELGTYDRDAYRKISLVFRCVQYLSNAAGSAPLKVYLDRGGKRTEEPDHPLRWLMERPNAGMGEGRFLSFLAMLMAVSGFALVEKERNNAGEVIALWPLRSDWARPILRQNRPPDWEYRIPGFESPRILKAQNVIALTYADTPDLNTNPTGIGPLEAILREVGISSAMTDFLKVFMDRGAMPLYVLVPSDDPKVANQWNNQATKDAFMDAWRHRYGGLPNAVEPMPLMGIKEIKPLGLDFNELAYPDLNRMTDARICTGFGIPPILMGAEVGLEQATYSNYGQARTSFYEDTMTYFWGRMDDAFTRHLMPEFEVRPGYDIAFDTSDIPALQDDVNEAWTRATAAFGGSVISRHAAQREMGVEPHGPDEFLVPFNMVAVPNANGQRGLSPATIELLDGRVKALGESRVIERDGRRYLNEAALSPVERRAQAQAVSFHRASIVRLAELVEPRVATFLEEQKERVIEAVASGRSAGWQADTASTKPEYRQVRAEATSRRAIEEIDWPFEDNELLRILQAWLDTVGAAAFDEAASLIGQDISWDVSNPFLSELVNTLGQRVRGINATTRADVERIVSEALTEGTTMPDLADRLRGLYEETYNGRSMTIARTESQVAYNTASQMAYQASGVVSEVQLHDNSQHTDSYGASDGLSCAQRNRLIAHVSQMQRHIAAEHPNGTLAVSPIVRSAEGE